MIDVFIDLGAHRGDTVEQFISWGQLFGDISECEVYGFDPVSYHKDWNSVTERHSPHVKGIHFEKKAAWINDFGLIVSKWDNEIGTSVMPDKSGYADGKKETVLSFNFSNWLKRFEGKKIVVKMDVEGAEYPILRKMIEDGTDEMCDLIFVEWHSSKMGEKYKKEEAWIKKHLKCRMLEWR